MVLEGRRFAPVGTCIYCYRLPDEAGPLSDEHIIPLALNGQLVLPQSSCDECAAITSRFERVFAREMYGTLRVRREFASRRKRKRNQQEQSVIFVEDDKPSEVRLPREAHPGVHLVPILPPPGILDGRDPTDANPAFHLEVRGRPEEIAELLGAADRKVITKHHFSWNAFHRTYAKAAHAFLVAEHGIDGYDRYLPDLILGTDGRFAHFIGGFPEGESPSDTELRLTLRGEDYLAVEIQLMADAGFPTFMVVAGRMLHDRGG